MYALPKNVDATTYNVIHHCCVCWFSQIDETADVYGFIATNLEATWK